MKASRPQKVASPPPQPQVAEEPEQDSTRFMKRTNLVAKPTIGSTVIVTKVGLGKLVTQTASGTSTPE